MINSPELLEALLKASLQGDFALPKAMQRDARMHLEVQQAFLMALCDYAVGMSVKEYGVWLSTPAQAEKSAKSQVSRRLFLDGPLGQFSLEGRWDKEKDSAILCAEVEHYMKMWQVHPTSKISYETRAASLNNVATEFFKEWAKETIPRFKAHFEAQYLRVSVSHENLTHPSKRRF